jgi:hypothetical protein
VHEYGPSPFCAESRVKGPDNNIFVYNGTVFLCPVQKSLILSRARLLSRLLVASFGPFWIVSASPSDSLSNFFGVTEGGRAPKPGPLRDAALNSIADSGRSSDRSCPKKPAAGEATQDTGSEPRGVRAGRHYRERSLVIRSLPQSLTQPWFVTLKLRTVAEAEAAGPGRTLSCCVPRLRLTPFGRTPVRTYHGTTQEVPSSRPFFTQEASVPAAAHGEPGGSRRPIVR